MRIAGLIADPFRALGDPPTRFSGLLEALAARGNDVAVVHPELDARRDVLALARSFHPRRNAWRHRLLLGRDSVRARTAAAERELERAGPVDAVLQFQCLFGPGRGVTGVHAIYTDHIFSLTRRLYPRWSPLSGRSAAAFEAHESSLLRAAGVVLTFSEFTRQGMIDDYGCDPERVHVVGTGTNVADGAAAEAMGEHAGDRLAFFAGYDFERKGGHVLLAAWPEVRRHLPDARLEIASSARAPALPEGVTWLGRLSRSELDAAYRRASAFVLPSLFEPFGLVFAEAMSCGLPCISTYTCGVPEIVQDGETGLLVQSGDEAALAAALVAVLGDPERARTMGAAGRARVVEQFTWERVALAVEGHLEAAARS
jgi:glycosyltransferase involved in cell wall biosynthesis